MKKSFAMPVKILSVFVVMLICVIARSPGQNTNALHSYDQDKPLTSPAIFGEGIISTGDFDMNGCFTPDGNTYYFAKTVPPGRMGVILVSHFMNGKWGTPEVAEFSGRYIDYDPFITSDGSKLFFISNRPAENKQGKDFDIYVMEKTGAKWSEPRNLGAPINSPRDEFFPSIASDGTLYFSAIRDGGKGSFDLYMSKPVDGKYAEPVNLGEAVNTQFPEVDVCVAADQSFMVFASSGRPDGLGDSDLYVSFNRGGVWTPAKNLGAPINSGVREFCPGISPDGKYLFFTSNRGFWDQPPPSRITYKELMTRMKNTRNGLGDIYQIDISALKAPQKMN